MTDRAGLVVKECEFITDIIGRLSSHGHSTKQLAVTVWMAAMGLGWQQRLPNLHLLAAAVSVLFWWLDALFLATERQFRYRYKEITEALAADPTNPDIRDPLSLKASGERCHACAIGRAMFSPSVRIFYAALVIIGVWAWYVGSQPAFIW